MSTPEELKKKVEDLKTEANKKVDNVSLKVEHHTNIIKGLFGLIVDLFDLLIPDKDKKEDSK